jgi:LPS O-antigen subunit length determinant protein (WzzB/FepE family)
VIPELNLKGRISSHTTEEERDCTAGYIQYIWEHVTKEVIPELNLKGRITGMSENDILN